MRFSVKKAFSVVTLLAMVVSSSVVLSADATTTKTTRYAKWTFSSNGSYTMSDYTLSLDLYSGTQTREIYPDHFNPEHDDRYRSGNTGIVQIMNGEQECATGFIVGDHTIATAAHCVYKWDDRNKTAYVISDPAIITYNDDGTQEKVVENGQTVSNSFDVTEIHIPYEYYSGLNSGLYGLELAHVDYALLTVEDDLSDYTHFQLGIPYHMNSAQFEEIDIYTTGLPYDLNQEETENKVYTAIGKEHPGKLSNSQLLYFTCDTMGGQSGSPVYTATEYYYPGMENPISVYTAIAILNKGSADPLIEGQLYLYYNLGACIDSSKLQFYYNNTYAST